jgi:hypothetical protein
MAKLPADEIILARKGHASDPKRDAAVQFARKGLDGLTVLREIVAARP